MSINSKNSKGSSTFKNILIIGNGGRENALAWAIKKNDAINTVYLIPGNGGSSSINKSKTTGEPPLMLGMSVFFAIKDAISSTTNYKVIPNLNAPATPEAILLSINDIKEKI